MLKKEKNSNLDNTSETESNKEEKEEIGGFNGPEPTAYGDWQHKGRVTDF